MTFIGRILRARRGYTLVEVLVVTALIVATAGATTWVLVGISTASIDASERLRQYTTIEQVVGLLGSRLSSTNSSDLGVMIDNQIVVGTETVSDPNDRPYSYSEIVNQDNPKAYFSFDQGPGPLTVNGGAQDDQPSLLPRYSSSSTERSIALGPSGYLSSSTISDQSSLDLGAQSWAIEAWFSQPVASEEPGIRVLYARQPLGPVIALEQGSDGQFTVQLYSVTAGAEGEVTTLLASGPLPPDSLPGAVYHLVVNWNQGQAKILINGQSIATSDPGAAIEWPGNQGTTSFGALPLDPEPIYFLDTGLDELSVYDQDLSEIRVLTHIVAGIGSNQELLQLDCRQITPASTRQPGVNCFNNLVDYQTAETERLVTEPGLLPTALAGDQFFFTRGGQCHRLMFIERRREIWLTRAASCSPLLMASGVARGPNQQIAGQYQFPADSPYYDPVLDGILDGQSLPNVSNFLLAEGIEKVDGQPVFNYLEITKDLINVDSEARLGSGNNLYRGQPGRNLVDQVAEVQIKARVLGNPERPGSDQRIGNRDYQRSIYLNQLCPPSPSS